MSCFSTVIWCNLGQILTKGANELWVKCFDKTEVDANPFAGQWPGLQPLIVSSGQAENSVLIKVKLIRLNQTFSRSTWFLCKNSCFSSTHLESWKRVQTNGDFSCHSLHLCSQSEGFQKVQTDRAAKMKMTWHVKAKMLLWTPRLYITDHTVCKTREAINPWGGISFQFSTWTFQDWSSTVHPFIFTPPPTPHVPTCPFRVSSFSKSSILALYLKRSAWSCSWAWNTNSFKMRLAFLHKWINFLGVRYRVNRGDSTIITISCGSYKGKLLICVYYRVK